MNFRFIFSFIVLICLLSSCKTTRLANGTKKLKKRSSTYLLKQLNTKKKSVEWFSAKALIRYEDEQQRERLTSYIRIRKDSIIWLNIKKVGVEGARIQITPDSIYIQNRLEKEYMVRSFDFVFKQFKLPSTIEQSLNFEALQNIFLGNPVFTPVKELEAGIEQGQYKLSGEYDKVESDYLLDGDNYELTQMKFVDQYDKKSLAFQYLNYQAVEEALWMALTRHIRVESEHTGTITMEIDFSKVEVNVPKKLSFKLSKRYKRV